ncbi:MBL fold metallo-hydrolase [Paenibacillus sp. GYB004]|uniref:MBL fold metallo-hydrolase n=1 Tax=Paenibacillus sp. GYB004 TaxID=2994393 RepID=UPI002F965A6B
MNCVNIGYNSTNYFAIHYHKEYLLIDTGLPGTLGKMKNHFQKYGIRLNDIKYLMLTHFHPDHCGIAQEIQLLGVELIIGHTQLPFLAAANESLAKFPDYKHIVVKPQNIINENDKISFYEKLGMPGYILHTPGHSEDSISIVIEGLGVFTGDLPFMNQKITEQVGVIEQSWSRIRSTSEKKVFPGHGSSFEL